MGKEELKRIVEMLPAYDRRHEDPHKNYGIHGVNLKMVLVGSRGAVQFALYTNWQLPHVTGEMLNKPIRDRIDLQCRFLPLPADLGYHSPVPRYEGQMVIDDDCKYLGGKPCYYDGSSLNAERIYGVLLELGSDGVWNELEEYYYETFEGVVGNE